MKANKSIFDEKVTRKSITPSSFLAVFLILMLFAIGQSFIIVIYFGSNIIPPKLLGALMIYWAIVTAAFSFLTAVNIRKRYTRPIQLMSDVTKKWLLGILAPVWKPTIQTASGIIWMPCFWILIKWWTNSRALKY